MTPGDSEGQLDWTSEASNQVILGLESLGLDYFINIPDSTAARVIQHFQSHPQVRCFSVGREEEGIGVASGFAIGGKRCVLLVQDTGLGNSMTALATFAQPYHVPILILAVRRGGLGEINAAVYGYSEGVPRMLEAARIKSFTLDYHVPLNEWSHAIKQAYDYSGVTHRPIVVLLNLKR